MAKVAEFLNSLDPLNKEYDTFLQYLLSSSCDIPLVVEEARSIEDIIVSAINTKINKVSSRSSGLEFIELILPGISKEILLKHSTLWFTKAIQTLESAQSNFSEVTIACKVLAALVIAGKEIPELHKQISMQSVKQFINVISNMVLENRCGATYYLISVLLLHYPEVCERSQDSIRKMIIPHVDSCQINLITASANCYTLLAKSTERSFKPPEKFPNYTSWLYNQLLLCNSLHDIMNELFHNELEFISSDKRNLDVSDTLDLPDLSENNILEYYNGLERRYINICTYLSTMLRGCGDRNSVSSADILQVLCRGLAITPFNLGKVDSVKTKLLFLILPKLHVSLLEILGALIEGFRKQLIPFAYTILKLIQQTLDWTEKVQHDQETLSLCKPFKSVRLSAYKALSIWLTYTGSLSGVETVSENILPHILKDIKISRNTVLLTVQKTSNFFKRIQKKLRESQYENSPLGNRMKGTHDLHLNADLCEEALVSLQNIFFSGSCWLSVSLYEKVKDEIINSLNDIYLGISETNVYKVNANCRLQLLKTLKAMQMNSHPLTSPPTQFSIEIFNMALKDEDSVIIQEAKLGLVELEKIVHPSAPTLNFPLETRNKNENEEKDENNEFNELINTTDLNQQDSTCKLLDSIYLKDSNKQHNKRASEHLETSSSKMRKIEVENESVSRFANLDTKEGSVQQDSSNLEKSNKEDKEECLSIEIICDHNSETLEDAKTSEEVGNEILKNSLTLDSEDKEKVRESLEEDDILQLFVNEVPEID